MAIASDRISFKSITDLTSLDFNKVTDIINKKDNISASSIAGLKTASDSVFNDNAKQDADKSTTKEILKGIIDCDTNSNRTSGQFRDANNRNLNRSLIDECIRKLNNLDRTLASPRFSSPNFNPLPAMTEGVIDKMMGEYNKTALGGQTKDVVNESLLNSTVKKEVYNRIGAVGMPIRAKLGLEKTAKGCKLGLSKLPSLFKSGALGAKLLGNLLQTLMCSGLDSVRQTIAGMINGATANPTGVVKSLASTIGLGGDDDLGNKLKLMSEYGSGLSAAHTTGLGPRIATNISESNMGEISSYGDMVSALSVIDPGWNTDETGQTNNSFMVFNPTIVNQANNITLNRQPTTTYNGSVTTNVDSTTEISIMSKFI